MIVVFSVFCIVVERLSVEVKEPVEVWEIDMVEVRVVRGMVAVDVRMLVKIKFSRLRLYFMYLQDTVRRRIVRPAGDDTAVYGVICWLTMRIAKTPKLTFLFASP